MANIQSAIKRVRQNAKRRNRNRMVRSRARTFVKKANASIATGDKPLAEKDVRAAISELDRATQKGIIHRNNAARRKSRLMKNLGSLTT